ncbi:hypothetical protein BpHYR1_035075 [Brachionus plicatilis]|uniref:Uncharacterized protein n=1 Tax=Brachionus plicatilis TaxID=10195 RepID=A0A3M7SZ69_BRAPC|nr:hypothetical protein BpHYR1_035075 [Brachionus plicatilis]
MVLILFYNINVNKTRREKSNDILITNNELTKSRISLNYFHYSIQHMFKICYDKKIRGNWVTIFEVFEQNEFVVVQLNDFVSVYVLRLLIYLLVFWSKMQIIFPNGKYPINSDQRLNGITKIATSISAKARDIKK